MKEINDIFNFSIFFWLFKETIKLNFYFKLTLQPIAINFSCIFSASSFGTPLFNSAGAFSTKSFAYTTISSKK